MVCEMGFDFGLVCWHDNINLACDLKWFTELIFQSSLHVGYGNLMYGRLHQHRLQELCYIFIFILFILFVSMQTRNGTCGCYWHHEKHCMVTTYILEVCMASNV